MADLEFRLPDIGEGLAEAELVQWRVEVGDHVKENQTVAEVETDKAIVELPAPATGIVKQLPFKPGQRVKVGAVLFVLTVGGSAPVQEKGTHASVEPNLGSVKKAEDTRVDASVRAAPAVRKLARELGVNLAAVRGSGPGGRITIDDVQASQLENQRNRQVGEDSVERVPVEGLRRRIAEAMVLVARAVPHVSGFHEIDAYWLKHAHERAKKIKLGAPTNVTVLAFIVKTVALALREHPYLNAEYDEDGPSILLHKSRNIGIATATQDGLIVPVLHEADALTLVDIARGIAHLTEAARNRSLKHSETMKSTFTITNVGAMGGWLGTSLLHYPEAAILGVGAIEDKPVVRNGAISIRPILPLSLTFDHRIADGDKALGFIKSIRSLLESEESPAWDLK